jgi:hypothetical protein
MRLLALLFLLPQDAPDPKGVEFFEKRIRPVLADKCYSCHSQKAPKLKGGLYVDTREGLLKGGDTGPALRAGRPEQSLILSALRWSADLKMPPKEKLSAEVVADFDAWIRAGAADPRTEAAARKKSGMTVEEGRAFWAYRAPRKAEGDLDGLIRAKLDAAGLAPAPEAPPEVLLRRLHFDLVGLPPTPEEIDAFVAAPSSYRNVVDRLLASPRFGERWGRHWLDVARYAESLTLRGFILKEAWRYRDWVIDAYNADLPFDRFVREQIAGDLLPAATPQERRKGMIAASFLTLGNTNLEEQDKKQLEMDVVDEQLDTLGRAFLAQTIGCARCHDHKFDPVPTRDYYALAGILKNSRVLEHSNVSKWIEVGLPMDPAREAEAKKNEEAVAALQARIKAAKAGGPAGKGVLALAEVPGLVVDDTKAEKVGAWKASTHSGTYIGDGYVHDDAAGKDEKSLTFHPELAAGVYEVRFAYSHGPSRAANVPVTILSAEGEKTVLVNQQEAPPVDGRYVPLGRFRFENNQGYVIVSNEGTKGHVTADAMVFLGAEPPKAAAEGVAALEAELKRLQESGPKRDLVMAVREEKEIGDLRVHVRGSVHTQGERVPRGVLQVASAGPVAMPSKESGRRELADWIASPSNPLTARVYVNRVWHWLFGAGLVRTTDNFGTTGETPSHPELLDRLALDFVEGGGSTKALVRSIVLSKTYRQASGRAPASDPDNRLLSRANRRRLDAECLRDAMLSVSGKLATERPDGPTWPASISSDYAYRHAGTERSVYVPVFRNALPGLFQVFDFADTSVGTGRRDASTVAPQALFLLNNPFVLEQSKHAAARLPAEADGRARAVRAYRLVLGRPPTEAETAIVLRSGGDWPRVFHALFASAEFRYVE